MAGRFRVIARLPIPATADPEAIVNGCEMEFVACYRSQRGRRGGTADLAGYPELVRLARALRDVLLVAPPAHRKVA